MTKFSTPELLTGLDFFSLHCSHNLTTLCISFHCLLSLCLLDSSGSFWGGCCDRAHCWVVAVSAELQIPLPHSSSCTGLEGCSEAEHATAEEGVPSRPAADSSGWALVRLIPGSPPAPWPQGALLGLPAAQGEGWELTSGDCKRKGPVLAVSGFTFIISLKIKEEHMFSVHRNCSIFFYKTSAMYKDEPSVSFPQNHVHIFQKTPFLFCGVAVSQHLTSFGQICQSNLGKGIKDLSSQPV